MQLLTLPKIIFLDEPTSGWYKQGQLVIGLRPQFYQHFYFAAGLDSKSALELLTFLNELLALPSDKSEGSDRCKRAVVLTIHQPRVEIFLMLDKLLLLSEGKVLLQ